MADRYTYFPAVGVLLALVWTARGLLGDRPAARFPAAAAAAVVVACLALAAGHQTRLWGDEAAALPARNPGRGRKRGGPRPARGDPGHPRRRRGRRGAVPPLAAGRRQLLRLPRLLRLSSAPAGAARRGAGARGAGDGDQPGAGCALQAAGALAAIDREEEVAARRRPNGTSGMGCGWPARGGTRRPSRRSRSVLAADPGHAAALNNLGALYAGVARGAAVAHLRRAVEARPEYAEARFNLGRALVDIRRPAEGEAALREALRLGRTPRTSRRTSAWPSSGRGGPPMRPRATGGPLESSGKTPSRRRGSTGLGDPRR